MTTRRTIIGALSLLFLASVGIAAAEDKSCGASLQETAQNPIGSLISVPFQSNFNFGTGMLDRMEYVMNLQWDQAARLGAEDWRPTSHQYL